MVVSLAAARTADQQAHRAEACAALLQGLTTGSAERAAGERAVTGEELFAVKLAFEADRIMERAASMRFAGAPPVGSSMPRYSLTHGLMMLGLEPSPETVAKDARAALERARREAASSAVAWQLWGLSTAVLYHARCGETAMGFEATRQALLEEERSRWESVARKQGTRAGLEAGEREREEVEARGGRALQDFRQKEASKRMRCVLHRVAHGDAAASLAEWKRRIGKDALAETRQGGIDIAIDTAERAQEAMRQLTHASASRGILQAWLRMLRGETAGAVQAWRGSLSDAKLRQAKQHGVDVAITTANKGETALQTLQKSSAAREVRSIWCRMLQGELGVSLHQWRRSLQEDRAEGANAVLRQEALGIAKELGEELDVARESHETAVKQLRTKACGSAEAEHALRVEAEKTKRGHEQKLRQLHEAHIMELSGALAKVAVLKKETEQQANAVDGVIQQQHLQLQRGASRVQSRGEAAGTRPAGSIDAQISGADTKPAMLLKQRQAAKGGAPPRPQKEDVAPEETFPTEERALARAERDHRNHASAHTAVALSKAHEEARNSLRGETFGEARARSRHAAQGLVYTPSTDYRMSLAELGTAGPGAPPAGAGGGGNGAISSRAAALDAHIDGADQRLLRLMQQRQGGKGRR